MPSVLPSYDIPWLPYSSQHNDLAKSIEHVLDDHANRISSRSLAYAVVGTFGAGKTQFLFHVYKRALAKGLAPLYLLAEDVFAEILTDTSERVWLPSHLASLVRERLSSFNQALAAHDEAQIAKAFGTRSPDIERMLWDLLKHVRGETIDPSKVVLLVDEVEQQYRTLQDRIQADERSPLREWLEADDHLKLLALAPGGIYEMGGADQSRVTRFVLPAVEPRYVRQNYGLSAGRANAAWWFSRGKPRHLSKAIDALKTLPSSMITSDSVLLLCRDGLDHVGQDPSAVPAGELAVLEASEYPKLLEAMPLKSPCACRL
jgi:hypothetical protein